MDVENFSTLFQYLSESGYYFNDEIFTALQSSLIVLQNENHLKKIYFWGKIVGIELDYYIAFGFTNDILKKRLYFYSQNTVEWFILQRPKKDAFYASSICNSMFQGDPRLEIHVLDDAPVDYFKNATDKNTTSNDINNKVLLLEDEDIQYGQLTREGDGRLIELNEEERLGAVVRVITREAAAIPRGAIYKRTDGSSLPNPAFQGLSRIQGKDLRNYLHFRIPKQRWDKNLTFMPESNYETDFMDPIINDIPKKGCWSSQITYREECVVLKNLCWPGMTFIHALQTPYHGFIYVGNGHKNIDAPFMVY